MKILILNKYDNKGGAAIAAQRLENALLKNNVDCSMLVDIKSTQLPYVKALSENPVINVFKKYKFLFEKLLFIPFEVSKEERFSFSTSLFGNSIKNRKTVKKADVIHLHWINHSFLSVTNIKELNKLNKPIVITMHDMWYATGGCHHSRTCTNYTKGCGNCMFLSNPKSNDISAKQFAKKEKAYSSNLTFVGCSNWITELAKQSPLLSNSKVLNIPNPIDISLFTIQDKKKAKQLLKLDMSKKHILFAAANVTNPRKGYKYLEKALENLKEEEYEIIVLGDDKNNEINFAIPTIKLGYVSDLDTIITAYNAADVFVSPTLEDNLPNTIMESMSCGTPCVAFKIGGIPDLIDHKKNGYLAQYMNSEDLSSGIKWVLSNQEIGKLARKKVETTFSEEKIASQFIELYESLI